MPALQRVPLEEHCSPPTRRDLPAVHYANIRRGCYLVASEQALHLNQLATWRANIRVVQRSSHLRRRWRTEGH